MSAIPGLKKKLKGIRAAGKLSKAMKTVSAAKFSKLSAQFRYYAEYARQYRELVRIDSSGTGLNAGKPDTLVVFGSEKGFCGGFNNAILQFLKNGILSEGTPAHLIVCGQEMGNLLADSGIPAERVLHSDGTAGFAGAEELCTVLTELTEKNPDGRIALVYPVYRNTMTQAPVLIPFALRGVGRAIGGGEWGYEAFPDRQTVMNALAERYARTVLYGIQLETALGAQAATMMTMRSAYDTAKEFTEELEGEIHRQRQRDVTADVLETSSDKNNRERGADNDV